MDKTNAAETKEKAMPSGFFNKWWIACRPFALPASTIAVIFGGVLALTVEGLDFNWFLFILSLIGIAVLHTGSNLLNDVYDYKHGIDQQVNPVSGGVIRGWISHKEGLLAGWLFLILGSLIGIVIVIQTSMLVFWIGLLGVTIGILYTWGPAPLKFNALGDLAVFLNFGLLGSLGAWTVQTGYLDPKPVIWAVPISLLVVAILHANNWRDIQTDKASGIKTIAALIGDGASNFYYQLLLMLPFLIVLTLVTAGYFLDWNQKMPYTFLIVFLAAPKAFQLIRIGQNRQMPKQPHDFIALDGATAQLNLLYGALCIIALVLFLLI